MMFLSILSSEYTVPVLIVLRPLNQGRGNNIGLPIRTTICIGIHDKEKRSPFKGIPGILEYEQKRSRREKRGSAFRSTNMVLWRRRGRRRLPSIVIFPQFPSRMYWWNLIVLWMCGPASPTDVCLAENWWRNAAGGGDCTKTLDKTGKFYYRSNITHFVLRHLILNYIQPTKNLIFFVHYCNYIQHVGFVNCFYIILVRSNLQDVTIYVT